ncbi:hypothetical protein [Bounagaea algeriensis]
MLRNIPVLLEGYKLQVSEEPTVKTREDENGNEVVVTDYQGATQYLVSLFVKPVGQDGKPRGKGDEIKVTVATEPEEEVTEGSRVELVDPRVSHWQNDFGNGTTSGLSWKATGIKPINH